MSEIIDVITRLSYVAEDEGLKKTAGNITKLSKEIEKLTDETKDYQQYLDKNRGKNAKLDAEAIAAIQKNTAAIKEKQKALVNETLASANLNKELVKEIGLLGQLNNTLDVLKAKKAFAGTDAELSVINKQINEINTRIRATGEATATGLNKAFSGLRQLAYLIPGLGIAGIFNLGFEAIGPFLTKLFSVTNAMQELSNIRQKGIEDSAKEVVAAQTLYVSSQNLALSYEERLRNVNKLQEEYPRYFGNLKDEDILAGKASDTYDRLRRSIINAGIARAAQEEIVNVTKELLKLEIKRTENEEALIKQRQGRPKQTATNLNPNNPYGITPSDAGSAGGVLNIPDSDLEREAAKLEAQIERLQKIQQKYYQGSADLDKVDKVKKAKAEKSVKDESDKLLLEAEKARFMANYELLKADSQNNAEINKKIVADEKESLAKRQQALEDYYSYKINLLDIEQTKELFSIDSQNKAIADKTTKLQNELNKKGTSEGRKKAIQKELAAESDLLTANNDSKNIIEARYLADRNKLTDEFGDENSKIVEKYAAKEVKAIIDRWKRIKEFNKQADAEMLDLIRGNLEANEKMWAQADKEIEDRNKKIIQSFEDVNTVIMSVGYAINTVTEMQIQAIDAEITAQQSRITRAMKYAERGGAELLEIEEERLKQLEEKREKFARRQLQINSALALSNAIVAVASTAAQSGVASIGTIPAVLAAIAAGYAFVNTLQEPQSFAEGTKSVDGPGTETSDSIPARLSKGERVIPARRSRDFKPVLDDIQDGKFKNLDDLYSKIRTGEYQYGMNYQSAINSKTNDKPMSNADVVAALADVKQSIEDKPVAQMNADADGLAMYYIGFKSRIQKRNRY